MDDLYIRNLSKILWSGWGQSAGPCALTYSRMSRAVTLKRKPYHIKALKPQVEPDPWRLHHSLPTIQPITSFCPQFKVPKLLSVSLVHLPNLPCLSCSTTAFWLYPCSCYYHVILLWHSQHSELWSCHSLASKSLQGLHIVLRIKPQLFLKLGMIFCSSPTGLPSACTPWTPCGLASLWPWPGLCPQLSQSLCRSGSSWLMFMFIFLIL